MDIQEEGLDFLFMMSIIQDIGVSMQGGLTS
jgi:hypothetical protein